METGNDMFFVWLMENGGLNRRLSSHLQGSIQTSAAELDSLSNLVHK